MDFCNEDAVKKLRMILLITGGSSLLAMVVLIVFEMFTIMVILASLFLITVLLINMLNFQYVKISEGRNKLVVRYYSIFAFERNYETFEFSVTQLRNVVVRKYFLGLKWDITFIIRVQKGLAEFPPVCFSAIPPGERSKLVMMLKNLTTHRQTS
jgi:hypothetical protein